jgi:hypothetical protein
LSQVYLLDAIKIYKTYVSYRDVVWHYFRTDMYWEEKIDKIKKETNSKDFRVPFADWSAILKSIETYFIVKEDSNNIFSNWVARLKDKQKIKTCRAVDLETELGKLNAKENFWLVISGDNPTTKNLVYDCKLNVILRVLGLREGDFFIVNKKYEWLTYFRYDQTDVEIFKSGNTQTPWDKK